MDISIDEALSLLRKWQQDRRLIQCGLFSTDGASSTCVGRVESIDGIRIRIDAGSMGAGKFFSFVLELSNVKELQFQDYRDAPPEFSKQLQAAYDAFIFVQFSNSNCELYAMKTGEELPRT